MSKHAWPESIVENSATLALECALTQGRIGHGMLFVSDDFESADAAAESVSCALLGGSLPHADYIKVEPVSKQRLIRVEPMQELRVFLQMGSFSGIKVAHISQAERLHPSAANLFLKILEEPPQNSYIIMTTNVPYAVLPTLVSRAMRFRFSPKNSSREAALDSWMRNFRESILSGSIIGEMDIYALVDSAYNFLVSQESSQSPTRDGMTEEVIEALEIGRQKMAQRALLGVLEETALEIYKTRPRESFHLTAALKLVEKVYRLLGLNLNPAAALESAIGGVMASLA